MDNERPYKIEKVSSKFVLVLSTSYESPLGYIGVLMKELDAMNFTGTVLFDLLLCNGNVYNRFVEVPFALGQFNRSSMSIIDYAEIDDSILTMSSDFYKSNCFLLETNHILLDEEKRELICR